MTERYPFDYEALNKGDEISREQCERAFGLKAGTDEYRLRLLQEVSIVSNALEAFGRPSRVCVRKHGLRVLTDSECVVDADKREVSHLRGFFKVQRTRLLIDRSKISPQEQARLERSEARTANRILALQEADRQAKRLAKHSMPRQIT